MKHLPHTKTPRKDFRQRWGRDEQVDDVVDSAHRRRRRTVLLASLTVTFGAVVLTWLFGPQFAERWRDKRAVAELRARLSEADVKILDAALSGQAAALGGINQLAAGNSEATDIASVTLSVARLCAIEGHFQCMRLLASGKRPAKASVI